MDNRYKKHLIKSEATVKEALEQLNNLGENLTLFVTDDQGKLMGSLTDGDIRRGLINGLTIQESVDKFVFKNCKTITYNSFNISELDELRKRGIKLLPIVDGEYKFVKFINFNEKRSLLPIQVILMAGGEGKRLRPLTDDTPKPLLKIGDKPIMEHNIDRLSSFGIEDITISINYLGDKIRNYFKDGSEKQIQINYIQEDKPLGTIGSASLVKNITQGCLLVMNSDILTNIDYEDMYKMFLEKEADLIVAAIPYQVSIPYAVLEAEGEVIKSLQEKPTYTYYANAGIYLMKKEMLELIPKDRFYNATDLIENLVKSGKKVLYYPLLTYWMDIGQHQDFQKAQEDIKHTRF